MSEIEQLKASSNGDAVGLIASPGKYETPFTGLARQDKKRSKGGAAEQDSFRSGKCADVR